MSVLQSLVEVEMMNEADIKAKYGTSSTAVKRVLKVLLVDELNAETKKVVAKGEAAVPDGLGATENRRKRKNNAETASETPENVV